MKYVKLCIYECWVGVCYCPCQRVMIESMKNEEKNMGMNEKTVFDRIMLSLLYLCEVISYILIRLRCIGFNCCHCTFEFDKTCGKKNQCHFQ